ncbi:MAG: phytoene/squalene synthase family protein [Steroidobacteraceae bacterium]|jgi:phytoene synthase|nr:phytoene/squalene synthase family protein [Steroidobacteraceae bacterium]
MASAWTDDDHATRDDLAACRALLREGSKTFHAASIVLPGRVREPAIALYAFCRLADDAVDVAGGGHEALEHLRHRLDLACAGRPLPEPADRALADVLRRFGIPRELPAALLDGFDWDARGRRYETLDDLLDYCARVAGTVGAMMALLMGRREADVLARACDLGVAMQLTNVARDVGEDARLGRIYLPLAWLRAEGIDPDAWLARPVFDAALPRVVRRVLDYADELYLRATAGLERLPADCRPGMWAARLMYAEIGREVERRGYDSVNARAIVSGPRKLRLLAEAVAAAARGAADVRGPAPDLPAVRFLVEAAVRAGAHRRPGDDDGFAARARRVLDLIERLERLERIEREPRAPAAGG